MKRPIIFVVVLIYAVFVAWRFFTKVGQNADKQNKEAARPVAQSKGDGRQGKSGTFGPALAGTPSSTPRSSLAPKNTGGRIISAQKAEVHIDAKELGTFKPYVYPGGQPAYKGEPVVAYVRVPSTGQEVAMTVNQGGEYPRLATKQGEKVQVRLAFSKSKPESPVAFAAQDGGKLEGDKRSMAGWLDGSQQIAFAYTVSPNPGLHRVTIESSVGETKTLEFWSGPPMPIKKLK